jgi:mRNA interferase RelE/StbE
VPGAVSTPSSDRYNLLIARSATKALTDRLPEKIAHAVYVFITGPLLANPRRVGKPLGSPLEPAYSARRGDYRVLYFIDDATRVVKVTTISHRADEYQS